jgi:glycosidase
MSLEGATLEGAMMHMAFMISVRGTPQLYAGEELAMEGKDDPDNRRDFPGGFPSDKRNAFTSQGRTSDQQRMFEWTRSWLSLRKKHSAIRNGRLIDLFADDDLYVFARQNKNETLLLAFNRNDAQRQVGVSARAIGITDGKEIQTLIGPSSTAHVVSGEATLTIPARTAVAFRAN